MIAESLNILRIKLRSYSSTSLKEFCDRIIKLIEETNFSNHTKIKGPIPLPIKRRRYCLLTSPHVNKKAREHFEIITYKKIIDVYAISKETIDRLKKLAVTAGIALELEYSR